MSEEIKKLIDEKIEELYNSLMEKPLQVLDIFNDFFGEENVDMQGYYSLEDFKSGIKNSFINDYVSENRYIDMSLEEWNIYNNKTILELPESQIIKILDNLPKLKRTIGLIKLGNIFILVHFPHVRVTNEHNRFVDINHLWVKIKISYDGTLVGFFSLNRSEYTLLHMSSNYLHSHVSGIPVGNFTEFQVPCTGSGPINDTITTLNRDYDEDMWNMFCLELSKYVTVESIAGVPYRYLERLGTNNMEAGNDSFLIYNSPHYFSVLPSDKLKDFVKHFINTKKLKFNYVNGSYSIGMSFSEYIILISNEFISWYNNLFNKFKVTATFDTLKDARLLKECIIDNGKIYSEVGGANRNRYISYIGKEVCMFKGSKITVNITDVNELSNDNKSIIFDIQTALYILQQILKVLNYRYGRETDSTEGNQLGTEVRYL